jgi:signal transduction histidine kinase/ABC-type branched-subunit amino acid transport system ATPase component
MNSNNNPTNILELYEIMVKYGSHTGLHKCSLAVRRGEIHVIAGTRGAGKSSLIGVISGSITPLSGSMVYNGREIQKYSAINAQRLGITTIYSDVTLFQNMTVIENIFLNREIRKFIFFKDNKKMASISKDSLRQLHCDINPELPVRFYDKTIQQKIYLASMLCFNSELIVIDEISDQFKHEELENILHLISMLRKNGATIIYVSSDVDEIYKFANRITFLQNGEVMNTEELTDIDELKLVELTYSSMFNRTKLEKSNLELFYLNNLNRNILKNLPIPILVLNSINEAVFCNIPEIDLSDPYEKYFLLNEKQLQVFQKSIEKKNSSIISNASLKNMNHEEQEIDIYLYPFFDDEKAFIGTIIFWFSSTNEDIPYKKLLDNIDNPNIYMNTISSIEHEINNPLEIISNYLHLISTEGSCETIHEKTKIMHKEINRIKRILKRIVGKEQIDQANNQCKLTDSVNEVINFLKTNIDKKEIEFKVDISSGILINMDQDSLKQILINIVLNAIESIEKKGNIAIYYEEASVDSTNYSIIHILDTGKGISEEEIDKIFTPFYSTKGESETRGLGLSISQDIAQKLGGFINVRSRLNKGSTFSIHLPMESRNG